MNDKCLCNNRRCGWSGIVIDLQAAKEEREPHLSGQARCLACKHEWMAVTPIGTVWIECPSCSLHKGAMLYTALRDGDHWVCNCDCELFRATADGMYCPNCGEWQHGF